MSSSRRTALTDPFGIGGDARFFFKSKSHAAAYSLLLSRLSKVSNVTALIGAPGSGKTTLLRRLSQDLEAGGKSVLFPTMTHWSYVDLLAQLCEASGADCPAQPNARTQSALVELLESQIAAHAFLPVLLDEAQSMRPESLTGIWEIAQHNREEQRGISVVLAGDHRLEDHLHSLLPGKTEEMTFIHLDRLADQEIGSYVRHYLETAGFPGVDVFTPDALHLIGEKSLGLPRLVNHLSSLSLRIAGLDPLSQVTPEHAKIAADLVEHLDLSRDWLETDFPTDAFPIDASIDSHVFVQELPAGGHPEGGASDVAEAAGPAEAESHGQEALVVGRERPPDALARRRSKRPVRAAAGGRDARARRSSANTATRKARLPARAAVALSLALPLGIGLVAIPLSNTEQIEGETALQENVPPMELAEAEPSVTESLPKNDAGKQPETDSKTLLTAGSTTESAETVEMVMHSPSRPEDLVAANDIDLAEEDEAVARAPAASNETLIDQTVRAVPPKLALADAEGLEGAALPLSLALEAAERDAVELFLSGLPAGSKLSAGAAQADGRWALSASALDGLELQAPAGVSGVFPLQIEAVAQGPGGDRAQSRGGFELRLLARAVPPKLTLADAEGLEGAALPLGLALEAAERDAVELFLSGLPAGSKLSAGSALADGRWSLPVAALEGLELQAPAGVSGVFPLQVEAVAEAPGGDRAQSRGSFELRLLARAVAPKLTLADAEGLEGAALPLSLALEAAERDAVELFLSGLPEGAKLSAGETQSDGRWSLPASAVEGLELQAPAGVSGVFPLQVEAVAQAPGGDRAQSRGSFELRLLARAVAPKLTLADAEGLEGAALPLALSLEAAERDAVELFLSGLPAGAKLSAGSAQADGRWALPASALEGLELQAPAGVSGVFPLQVEAVAQAPGGDRAQSRGAFELRLLARAVAPKLALADAEGLEGAALPLSLALEAAERDAVELFLSGLPAGSTLSAGSALADGRWSLPAAALEGLELQAPAGVSGVFPLQVEAVAQAPGGDRAQSRGGFELRLLARAVPPKLALADAEGLEGAALPLSLALEAAERDAVELFLSGLPAGAKLSAGEGQADGRWSLPAAALEGLELQAPAGVSGVFPLQVEAVAQAPGGHRAQSRGGFELRLLARAVPPKLALADAEGLEGAALPLPLALEAAERDAVELFLSGLPAGSKLSAGSALADGRWALPASALEGLELQAPAGVSGIFPLQVEAVAQAPGGDRARSRGGFELRLLARAVAPKLALADAEGLEGAALPLPLALEAAERDAVELFLSGLPAGAKLSAGEAQADGRWALSTSALDGLELQAPAGVSGVFPLQVEAVAQAPGGDRAQSRGGFELRLLARAVPPKLALADAEGLEGAALPLSLALEAAERDAVELFLSGLPAGAKLSAGEGQADGRWSLPAAALEGLELQAPAGVSGVFPLQVEAVAQAPGGHRAQSRGGFELRLLARAVPPKLALADAEGLEGAALPLPLALEAAERDAVELFLSGLPAGSKLSAGSALADGRWALPASALEGLELQAPAGVSGIFPLQVEAVAQAPGGDRARSRGGFELRLLARAVAPKLALADAEGLEGAALPLPLALEAAERDAVELFLSGLPEGSKLSAGRVQADGRWALPAAALEGLELQPPAGVSGVFPLQIEAVAQAPGGDRARSRGGFELRLLARAVAPKLALADAEGLEGAALPLALALEAAERDAVELFLSGLPEGSKLSAGTVQADGRWALPAASLEGLVLQAPVGVSGIFPLQVEAVAQAPGGDRAQSRGSFELRLLARAVAPKLALADAEGLEGAALPLSLALEAAERDAVELFLSGLPAGSKLSAGEALADGRWALPVSSLEGLELQAPAGVSGVFPLQIEAVAQAPGGDRARSRGAFELRLLAQAPAPDDGSSKEEVGDQPASDPLAITSLLSQGTKHLTLKDISSARLYFELAAELGSAQAAGLVGLTHDPIYLKEVGVLGMSGDKDKAIEWYRRALEGGDETFSSNLDRLK